MLENLTELQLLVAGLLGIVLFFMGHKIGSYFASRKCARDREQLETESHNTNKSLKRILEEEKTVVVNENLSLKSANHALNEKLEDYRKKLAGMGVLSFSGSKKRADILYSLLLENEALEQLLAEQGEKLADERKEHLWHRMKDIRKRQRLMAEIFNDDTIKNYVKDVLSDERKIEEAARKIESQPDTEKLPSPESEEKASPANV